MDESVFMLTRAEPTSRPWLLGYSPAEPGDPSVGKAGTEDGWTDEIKILSFTWLSVERLVEQMRMGREGCSLRGDPRWSDSRESRWKQGHLQTPTAHHQTWTHKLWPLRGWSYLITQMTKSKKKKSTCVTAYWAKDKYSTRTSRPWFSSFRNSLTHLRRDRGQSHGPTATPMLVIMINNNERKRKKKKKGKNSKPNMVCAERNLKLSKCLSWFLDPPSELLKTDR